MLVSKQSHLIEREEEEFILMKKILYIIPGWGDKCSNSRYQQLASVAKGKGYEVVFRDVDWKN